MKGSKTEQSQHLDRVYFLEEVLIKGSHRHVNGFEYIYSIKFTMDMQKKKRLVNHCIMN